MLVRVYCIGRNVVRGECELGVRVRVSAKGIGLGFSVKSIGLGFRV